MKRFYATALTLTLLGGCAAPTTRPIDVPSDVMAREAEKQKELALESLAKDEERLFSVAFRLKTGAAEMCRNKVKPQIGLMASNLQLLKRDLRPVAARALGLTDAPKVTHIAPASPAYAAGFRKGDVLKTLNGWEVPTGENATKFFSEKLAQVGSGEAAIFTVERAGQIETVQVRSVMGCDYPVELGNGDEVNAYADGNKVIITRGMLRFAHTDEELALVVSMSLRTISWATLPLSGSTRSSAPSSTLWRQPMA